MDLDKLLDGVTLTKLQKIFEAVMKRQQDKIDPVRSTFGTIKKEPVSLEDKITSGSRLCEKTPEVQFPPDAGKTER